MIDSIEAFRLSTSEFIFMNYSLDPGEVKKFLDAIVTGKEYNMERFGFYHLNRNHFNVKNTVGFLKAVGDNKFKDKAGAIWEEQPFEKNTFHMPLYDSIQRVGKKLPYIGGKEKQPYSRKFLRDDPSPLQGEFELVIRRDEKRIGGDLSCRMQETYNYGRTRDTGRHALLDVSPHFINGLITCNYVSVDKMDDIKIYDLQERIGLKKAYLK